MHKKSHLIIRKHIYSPLEQKFLFKFEMTTSSVSASYNSLKKFYMTFSPTIVDRNVYGSPKRVKLYDPED